jgi:hypothetical protein
MLACASRARQKRRCAPEKSPSAFWRIVASFFRRRPAFANDNCYLVLSALFVACRKIWAGSIVAAMRSKDVVSFFRLPANNHVTLREIDFLANLIHHVPLVARRQCRGDELGADVLLRQGFLSSSGMTVH